MLRKTKSALIPLMLLVSFGLVLAGCNTTQGFGEDVESAGEEIQEEAEDAK